MDIWDQATELHKQDKFAEAQILYEQLLTQNPKNPGLLATLGTLYLQTGRYGLAIALLEASMKWGKRESDALCNLAVAYKNTGQNAKSRELLEAAIKLEPSAQCLANYGGLFIESGCPDKVMDNCTKAIELDPSLAIAHWNLSLAQLGEGQFTPGWDEYEWGLKTRGMREDRAVVDVPWWDGTPGKTVLVYGEQGMGDEIMFASMLPDLLKTNAVILESHKRLATLFDRSFNTFGEHARVHVYGTREDKAIDWPHNHVIDYRLSIGSLGKFYRRERKDFPGTSYLRAEPLDLAPKFRVGISWTGGQKAGRVQKRSVALARWKSILNVPDVEFVSLQYTDCADEIAGMNRQGYDLKTMDEYVKAEDYYQNARLVASCDLVISVCTSLIHLAGALGVPCWVMTPANPAWRYQSRGGIPWYRSVRLYRQAVEEEAAWVPVVQRVGLDLAELRNAARRIWRAA